VLQGDGQLGGANDGDHLDQPGVQSRHQRRQKGGVAGAGLYYGPRPPCPCPADDRGLSVIEDYLYLTGGHISLAEALAQPGAGFDFNPPRVGGGIFKPADLG
jgi:hypothetical protein